MDEQELQVPSPALIQELQDMLAWWRARKMEPPKSVLPPLAQTPDVYIARAPKTGIPAREDDPGSGCPGSGTDSSIADVFSADCECYRIDDSVPSDVDLFKIHRTLPIYNIGPTAIAGHAPLLVVKDKTGKWVGVPIITGGTTLFVFFTLSGALTTSTSSVSGCTVNRYFGGANPGATITVSNVPASSNYIFSGASGHKGIAVYDERSGNYWIIQMECP